jgi:hypothetical protein
LLSALAHDADRGARGRGLAGGFEDLLHGHRTAHELGELAAAALFELGLEGPVLRDETPLLEGLLDDVDDLVVAEGLGQIVKRALPHGRDGALDRRVRRDDHDGQLG